jgi:hypothetical protein
MEVDSTEIFGMPGQYIMQLITLKQIKFVLTMLKHRNIGRGHQQGQE